MKYNTDNVRIISSAPLVSPNTLIKKIPQSAKASQGVFSAMGAGVKTNIVFFEKSGEPTKEIWYYELEGKFTKKNRI